MHPVATVTGRGANDPQTALAAARRGELPEWATVSPERREHIRRVAALMEEWAVALSLPPDERERWRAAAWLHDALRDAPADALRGEVGPAYRDFLAPLLHGPAAAARLGDGDAELAEAVRYHTLGHPALGQLGRALYLADFLEPGRDFEEEWRAELRARMPEDLDGVLREVVRARIQNLLSADRPVRAETVAFWNSLACVSS
ncbi:bis(5'-nucleosyl)-tetraphosphatase (symmetrical) YqeK [soil metagenome]